MRKQSVSLAALALAGLLVGCDALTGPDLTRYRDVGWSLVGVDDSRTGDWRHPIAFGSYEYQPALGARTSCVVTGELLDVIGWGWVENAASGKVVRVGFGAAGEPTNLLDVYVYTTCGSASAPKLLLRGQLYADVRASKKEATLDVRSVALRGGFLGESPVSDEDFGRWAQVALGSAPLAATMRVPLRLSIRFWTPGPGGTPEVGWEATRTFQLVYARGESLNERGSP